MAEVIPIRPGTPLAPPRIHAKPSKSGGHIHEFDPASGWCLHCTYREDGRLTGPGGAIWHPGQSELELPEETDRDDN